MKQEELLQRVLARDNLWRAWKRVVSNKGAPGIDGVRVEDSARYMRQHWPQIRQQIETGRYRPQPVRRVEIPKADGGKRALGIPTVMDRVIQQAIAQVLGPIYEAQFSDRSYGFRPGRGAHQAIRRVQQEVGAGWRIAVDIDLAKFFDTVNHDVLMGLLGRDIADKRLLRLIASYLRAGVLVGEHIEPSEVGTPQGGPLSPLLANVVLHQLDMELSRRGHRFARYADDLVILVRSPRAGQRVMESVTRLLERRLRLKVNTTKSKVAKMQECKFLGFTVQRGKVKWHDTALDKLKHRVRELTSRTWGVSMEHRLDKLGESLRGWMGYFGISQYWKPVERLDEWIRRRMRAIYWKRWKSRKTRIRELIRRGVKPRDAYSHGLSSRGEWHMSRTPAMARAFTNATWQKLGLVSAVELWKRAQGYA